jgi:hypothetical protein
LAPGEYRDYAGGPSLGRDVGQWLECRFLWPEPRWTSWGRGRRAGPRGARGSGPEGSKGFLILAARRPSAAAGQRRSGRRRWRGCPLTPSRAARPSFIRDALTIQSQSCLGRGCGGGSGCCCGLRGPPGLFGCGSPLCVRISETRAATSPAPRSSSRSLSGDRAPVSPGLLHLQRRDCQEKTWPGRTPRRGSRWRKKWSAPSTTSVLSI